MAEENFILVSLDDPKTKKLAQTISNDSCKKILNVLADKESTESEIAKELNIPISTVHYNLQQLTKAGLVVVEEFHYSKKGKEVNHYKLANKYVIIAPKSVWGIKEKLKSILPVAIVITGLGVILTQINRFLNIRESNSLFLAKSVADESFAESVPMASRIVADSASGVNTFTNITSTSSPELLIPPEPSLWITITQSSLFWFFTGALLSIILYLIIDYIRYKIRSRKTL